MGGGVVTDLLGLGVLLGVGLALYLLVLIAWTAWGLTHPRRRTYAAAVARGIPGDPSELDEPRAFEDRVVRALGHDLPVWEIGGDDADGPVVIMTPGWSDSRVGALVRLGVMVPNARRVIAWDPPGKGEAPGFCTLGTREVALVRALADEVAPREPVVLMGWSLGAGVSIAAAARSPGRFVGVVAEAPYRRAMTPARGVLRARRLPHRANLGPAYALLGTLFGVGPAWRGYDRAAHAANLRCPLLVLHGAEDPVCPIGDGRAIASAAPQGRIVETENAGHNNLWTVASSRERQTEAVAGFLRSVRGAAAGPAPTIPA